MDKVSITDGWKIVSVTPVSVQVTLSEGDLTPGERVILRLESGLDRYIVTAMEDGKYVLLPGNTRFS